LDGLSLFHVSDEDLAHIQIPNIENNRYSKNMFDDLPAFDVTDEDLA
jgi:hypothetical protein